MSCLTYCETEDLFYVVYGVMNARYFDVDNFLIIAKDIRGPWSAPLYLHSAGFDASILHDDDGRKYIVSMDWETRDGYEKPGAISLVEYDPCTQSIIGYPKRIWTGGTDRGCIEAPHLTKRDGKYYLMCSEGGTGYNHCVTMARSECVWGSYEGDPMNPILTSNPAVSNERSDPDHLKPQYFNPDTLLQKAGHGSYVETQLGEVFLVHLCARPFLRMQNGGRPYRIKLSDFHKTLDLSVGFVYNKGELCFCGSGRGRRRGSFVHHRKRGEFYETQTQICRFRTCTATGGGIRPDTRSAACCGFHGLHQ